MARRPFMMGGYGVTTFRRSRPEVHSLSAPAITASPYGQLENGSIVTAAPRRSGLAGEIGEILPDSVTVWVGTDRYRQIEQMKSRSRMVVGTSEWARYPFLPLSVFPSIGVGRDWFVVGDGALPELRYYNAAGQLQRVVRWNAPRRRVTDVVRREVAQMIAEGEPPADRRVWQRFATDAPYPELLPLFDKILLDQSRTTWLREFEYRSAQPERWTAFDAQGIWLGALTFPSGFSVTEFGLRHVAGVHRDEMGIQRAAVFSLIRR